VGTFMLPIATTLCYYAWLCCVFVWSYCLPHLPDKWSWPSLFHSSCPQYYRAYLWFFSYSPAHKNKM